MSNECFSWFCAILSVVGNIFVNYKNRIGMVIWIVSNFLWIYYATFVQINHAQVFMYAIFTLTNLHGIYKWRSGKK